MSESVSEFAGVRFCPMCGSEAGERFCPVDGTLMVRRQRPDPAALNYTPGHIIDHRYRILGSIGRGGFGAVYAATHTGTGQQVALKVLHVDTGADNQQMIRRFWQEAQITSRLRHANTVRVFDVGQTEEGAFYLAMEHLHGRTLADELDQRPGSVLSEAETAAIGIEICKSLQEAHRAGLVHRDLKPANVMLCETGERSDEAAVAGRWQVKVLDFGIARTADSSLTGQGAALGTPAFMSPEQCRGLDVGPRSDLYSLGVVLFRCVTGRLPFVDENPLAILFHHADTPAPDPRTVSSQPVSAALAEGLIKVLSKRADERHADAREMQQALQTVLLGTPALAGAAVSDLSGYRAATMLLEAPPAQPPSLAPVPARPSAPIAAPQGDAPAKSAAAAPQSAGSAALAAQRAQTSLAPAKVPAAASPAPAEPSAALQAAMGSAWGWKLMALALAGFAAAAVVLALMGREEAPPTQPIAGPVLQAEPGSAPPAQPPVAAPAALPVAAPAAEPLAAPAAAPAAAPTAPELPPAERRGDRPAGGGPAQNRAAAEESPSTPKPASPERRDDRPAARGSDRAFELRDEHPPAEKAPDKPADKSATDKAQAEKAAAEKAAAAKTAKPIEKPTALD